MFPDVRPATVGRNLTLIVQFMSAGKLEVQVPPVPGKVPPTKEKDPENVAEIAVKLLIVLLESVIVSTIPDEPTNALLKLKFPETTSNPESIKIFP